MSYPDARLSQPKVLRGYARINLQPNCTQTVTFHLSRYDLSIWDVLRQRWRIVRGDYTMWVGGKGAFDEKAVKGVLEWDVIYPDHHERDQEMDQRCEEWTF